MLEYFVIRRASDCFFFSLRNQTWPSMSEYSTKSPSKEGSLPFRVLINHEEQHCIWPAIKDTPLGWSIAFEGSSEACKSYIEANWTDMRPLSVRGSKI